MNDRVTVVLGASAKPDRYSNKAVAMLLEHGHLTIPVHPSGREVQNLPCLKSLSALDRPVDTVTVYVGASNLEPEIDELIALSPRRIILNPGAENPMLQEKAEAAGIEVLEACTLVLLATGNY